MTIDLQHLSHTTLAILALFLYICRMGITRTFTATASMLAILSACSMNLWEKPGSATLIEGYKLRDAGDYQSAYVAYLQAEEEAFHDGIKAKALIAQARALQSGQGVAENDTYAFTTYQRAAKLGNPSAELSVAAMLASGEGVAQNVPAAQEIYLQHSDRASAALALAELSDSPAEQQEWRNDARDILKAEGVRGNDTAMVQLARLYKNDRRQNRHLKRADYWYSQAVEAGNIPAVIEMAEFRAEHLQPNKEEQLALVNQAIEQNDPASLRWMGDQYRKDEMFDKDLESAKDFYLQAAELGDLPAEMRLAKMAENEEILAEREATRLARIEARQKSRKSLVAKRRAARIASPTRKRGKTVISETDSMLDQAQKLVAGVDGKPNIEKAYALYREASERGSPEAQYYLGVGYARGFGVEKNIDEAKHWLTKALSGGYILAESVLEMLLAE